MNKVNWQFDKRDSGRKGAYKISQEGLKKNEKRCSDCEEVKDVSEFFKGGGYKKRLPWCKDCWKARYHKSRLEKKREANEHKVHKYEIVYDPTGTYEVGSIFDSWDFTESLKGNIWPIGMMVKRVRDQKLLVVATSLIYVEIAYKNQEEAV